MKVIKPVDFTSPQVSRLLDVHLQEMHRNSPLGSVYALDFSALQGADISFWSVWEDADLLAFGALKQVDPKHGEIKSMRTDHAHRRRGAAGYLLQHLLDTAAARGYNRVSLETGSGDAFAPAIELYRRFGFKPCREFGEYRKSDFNQFMSLDLPARR